MLDINKHIETIVHYLDGEQKPEVHGHTDFITLKRVIPATDEYQQIERTVIVTAENDKRKFRVELEEIAMPLNFVTNRDKSFFDAPMHGSVMHACRYVFALLHGKVKPQLIPPERHVKKCEEINVKWLIGGPFSCALFLQGSEFGDDWRLRLTHADGQVICESLDPDNTDGHTCCTIARVAQESFDRGVREGETRVVERLCGDIAEKAISTHPHNLWRWPAEVANLIKTKTIRDKQAVI
jgi:hypothetical protein